jgi:hypothetical protein
VTETGRSAALRSARERRMAEWFKDRRWRVAAELTFQNKDMRVVQGEFWVAEGKVFRTPFGNKGTHGYILQEVDPATGDDLWDDVKHEPSRASFGWVTISSAARMYPGSIAEVPPRPYGKRGPSDGQQSS